MAHPIYRTCKRIFLELLTIFISLVLTLLLPLLISVLSPFYLYRFLLSLYVKHYRKDLGKILTCGNALLASYDEIYGDTQNTTVIAMKVEGIPNLEEARALAMERLIDAKTEQGIPKFPELQQRPIKLGGYYFWKSVEEGFNICHYINYYNLPEQGKVYSDEQAAQVESALGTKKHSQFRSPWEFVILPHVKSHPDDSDHSIIYLRMHHCITDGFGIFNLLVNELGALKIPPMGAVRLIKRNICSKVVYYISLVFRIPYDLIHFQILGMSRTQSGFKDSKNLSIENHLCSKDLQLKLSHLKDARQLHDVSFSAVILSLWIGALRKLMTHYKMKIPEFMTFGSPVPVTGHPEFKLRIHTSSTMIRLPTNIADPIERVKACSKILIKQKRSTIALGIQMLIPVIGALPPWAMDTLFSGDMCSGCLNNFPGPATNFIVFNKTVLGFHFSHGQTKLGLGMICTALSYLDKIFIKTSFNKALFKEQSDIRLYHSFIQEELDVLRKQSV